MSTAARRFLRSTRGANATEYIIVVGVVALAAVTAYQKFGVSVYSKTRTFADNVSTLTPTQGGSNYCFVAGTLVDTPNGVRPIEEMATGDLVLSRDEATGALATKHVVQTFITPNMPLVEVRLQGAFEPIRATLGHPFFTRDRGWVMAKDLKAEEPVVDEEGATIAVQSVERLAAAATVYNFEVEDTHTYFVGSAHIWVHNPNDCNGTPIDMSGGTGGGGNGAGGRPNLTIDTNVGGGGDGPGSPPPAPGQSPPTSPNVTLTPPTPTSPATPPDSPVATAPPNSPLSPTPPPSPVASTSPSPPPSPTGSGSSTASGEGPPPGGPSGTGLVTQDSPVYQMDQAFQNQLGQTPWQTDAGKYWKYANMGASAGLGVAGHFIGLGPVIGPAKATITAPINGAVALQQYNEMYGRVTPQMEALQQAWNSVPPDAAHDPERAAIAYTIDKMSRMLHNQYQNAQQTASAEGMAVNIITGDMGHGAGFIKTADGMGQKYHGIKKYVDSESGTDSTAAAYILADHAFLNGSEPAKQSLEALYGKEYTQQLGTEWQKIHSVEQGIDTKYNGKPPLVDNAGNVWKAEANLTQKWSKVNIQQMSEGDPSGVIKIPPKYGVPGYAMINNDVLTRPPSNPGRPDKVRPVEDYQNGVIKDEFGKQYVPPRNKVSKIWNSGVSKIPGVSKTQTPTQQIAGHISDGISGKPQKMQDQGIGGKK